jgi:hypothetical protein
MSAVEKLEHFVLDEVKLSSIAEFQLMLLELSGKELEPCSLAKNPGHPGDNWVTEQGGLPAYICNVAKHIKADGKDTSTAIAMAVSQIKKWIADPHTTPETKAKATAAIADWNRKKSQADAHHTVKEAAKHA